MTDAPSTDTLRTISITHPKMPDVKFSVGTYTPDETGLKAKSAGQKRVVVEIEARTANGSREVVGSLFLEQAEDTFAEIVRIGKMALDRANG